VKHLFLITIEMLKNAPVIQNSPVWLTSNSTYRKQQCP